jgi:hypothetical protein
MNPEDRLSEALHATLDTAQPSPDLADLIVERVSPAGPRSVPFHRMPRLRPGFVALVAVLLIAVAMVPVAINLRSQTDSVGSLAHFDRDGPAFDYPASWRTSVSGLDEHYISILDFLGTGSGLATCNTITPGPSDNFISGTECGDTLTVDPGQVVVELLRSDGPPRPGPIDPNDPSALSIGQKYVTVGGLPAIFAEGTDSTTPTLDWTLSVPEQLISRYLIHVEMKGPGLDQMRAQVEALVASVSYDPPVPVLKPADGPRIAAIGLTKATANDSSFACFPKVPGATATATITQFPMYSTLSKPLPVTCTTEIQPFSIGLWKMTLTESWTAASDRSAGSLTTTLWLDHTGSPGEEDGGPGPSEMPYWPVQSS